MGNIKCAVVIPTYNRPAHLKRILGYYYQYGRDLPVVIADSSSEENKKLNQETVTSFPGASFTYLDKYDPSTNPYHKILDTVQQVRTEYCVLCADDDFITPNGIRESTDFLDLNPDYSAAHGSYSTFQLKLVSGAKPKLLYSQVHCHSNTHQEPKARLIDEVAKNHHVSFFAVNHTDFKKMIFTEAVKLSSDLHIADARKLTSDWFFAELIIVWLPAIYGKIKYLESLYIAREDSTPAQSRRNYVTMQDILDERDYKEKKQELSDCVALHLSKQSGISSVEAKIIVDKMISVNVNKSLYSRTLTKLKLPNWVDRNIRKLYHFILPSSKTINYLTSKYCDDYNRISFHILSNAREVYGPIPGRNC